MKCPGQDMQYWKDDAIFEVKCPECHTLVEFYKDDTTRKCHECGHRFVNPRLDFGCATYCQFAEQCIGTLPEEFVMQQDSLLKDKVAVEVKRYFGTDFKQIRLASRLAYFAEIIGKSTDGANLAILLCSAYLYRVGHKTIMNAQKVYTDELLRKENILPARDILTKLQANDLLIDQVCTLIGPKDSTESILNTERQILADAATLTRIEELFKKPQPSGSEISSLKIALLTDAGVKQFEKIEETVKAN